MNNKKIIFMGSPKIASDYLEALIKSNLIISAVFSQPPKKKLRGMKIIESEVHQLANKNNIEVFCPNKFDKNTIEIVKKLNPDLIIVMAYGKILPKDILDLPPFGCINIHVSLLPRWRGAAPIEHSLMNGDKETGISIIQLIEKLDAGPIINQKKVDIEDDCNKNELSQKLTEVGIKLLVETIPLIFDKKIIFMGSPKIASDYLEALIENNFIISAVFTQPPKKKSRGMKIIESEVHQLANKNNIEVFCPNIFDKNTIEIVKKLNPDLIIVMAYGKILPKDILDLPPFGCINIHVSLLPRWRGAAPIEHSLMSGDKETGISIIQLIEKLDAGPIINQKKIDIEDDCNKNELSQKLTDVGIKLLVETIPLIFDKKISYSDQDDNYATYANKISSLNRKINFNKSVNEVLNLIRAHSPKPGAWFTIQNERIKIIKARKSYSIGNASTILNETFDIGCNDGSIEPLILQREGKNPISKDDFLRGYSFKVNEVINA